MKKIPYEVATFGDDSDFPEQRHQIDYANPRDRSWLAKHQTWAFNNGKGLTVRPVLF